MREGEVVRVRNWLVDHHRLVCMFLLALGVLNGWVSWSIFRQHPLMAMANAVMALVLVAGVIVTW
jgi:predicted negative regulator of RcsB-dependent stress response